jgi:hypothetical protein
MLLPFTDRLLAEAASGKFAEYSNYAEPWFNDHYTTE